jgi:hypothetical protein
VFHLIQQYPFIGPGDRTYQPRVYGEPQPDGAWGGWIVFFPLDDGQAIATDRETTQSTRESLRAWAASLTTVYLEGALLRALELTAEPLVLAQPPDAEYPASAEEAANLETVAEIELRTASIDEAGTQPPVTEARRISREHLGIERALANEARAKATVEADVHERVAREARAVASDEARRSRALKAAAPRRTRSQGRSKKKK